MGAELKRLLAAAKVYAFNYVQDEAEDEEDCVCGAKQHAEAKELFAAIAAVEAAPAQGALTDALPELPKPFASFNINGPDGHRTKGYTAEQMNAHVLADRANRGQVSDAADAWQPIATAPKDGTYVMLSNGVNVAQGWWEHQEPHVREQRDIAGVYIDQQEHDGFDDWLDCNGGMTPDPTHWKPLPAPPTIQAQAGDEPQGEADHG